MLKEILNALTGSTANTVYTYPVGNGINVPPQAAFGRILDGTINRLNNGAVYGFPTGGNPAQGFALQGQGQGLAAQASGNNFFAQQNFKNNNSRIKNSGRALTPGAVINSLAQPPQQAAPQVSPVANLATGLSPIPGFAGQTGIIQQGGNINGGFGPGGIQQQGNFGFAPGGQQSNFGRFQIFLAPILGLLGAIKSLFSLRGSFKTKPYQIDRSTISYEAALENYARAEQAVGSFEETYWDEPESNGLDYTRLEVY